MFKVNLKTYAVIPVNLKVKTMFQVHALVPELWCSNFNESLHFYMEVVGVSLAQRRGDDLHAYLELGNA